MMMTFQSVQVDQHHLQAKKKDRQNAVVNIQKKGSGQLMKMDLRQVIERRVEKDEADLKT